MEQNQNKETFHFTYSAKEQDEIMRIRKKYEAPKEDKMEQLRKLDASVTEKATVNALAVGIIGALVLGIGMSLTMTDLYVFIGIPQMMTLVIGVLIGIVGMAMVGMAYPVYNKTLKKERERVASEILELTEELMK